MKTALEIAADIRPTHPHVTELIHALVRENEEMEGALQCGWPTWRDLRFRLLSVQPSQCDCGRSGDAPMLEHGYLCSYRVQREAAAMLSGLSRERTSPHPDGHGGSDVQA